jgi:transcriptional regulator with XRE-family HTH domain
MQSMRREAIESALEMTRKYDAPYDFAHLRRGNWEIDRSLDHLLSAAQEFQMELSESPATAEAEGANFARYLGRRVRALRRTEGFRSARELADEVDNPLVSEGVIRNIESGRKADVSLVQVLEISQALDVSPIALLFDYRRPFHPVPPPGLGATFTGKSSSDLDTWFSQPNDPLRYENGAYRDSPLAVRQLSAARQVGYWLRSPEQPDPQEDLRSVVGERIPDDGPSFQRAARWSRQIFLEAALIDARELGLDFTAREPDVR